MNERRRFAAILVLLVAAIAVCSWLSIQRIEQDLLARTQIALASSSIPFYGVDVEGRDVVLTGFIDSPESADRIRNIVQGLQGVRAVRDLTVLERVIDSPSGQVAPRIVRTAPRLRLQRLGRQLFVSGHLPDDGTVAVLERAATERFGSNSVTSNVAAMPGVAHPAWLDAADRLIELLAGGSGNMRLVLEGNRGFLSGEVPSQAAADRLREVAGGIPEVVWTFELFSARGPVAGGVGP